MLKTKQDVITVLNAISDFEHVRDASWFATEDKYYHEPTLTMIRVHAPENPFDNYVDILCQITITSGKAMIPVHKFLMRTGTPVDTFKNYINNLIGDGTE